MRTVPSAEPENTWPWQMTSAFTSSEWPASWRVHSNVSRSQMAMQPPCRPAYRKPSWMSRHSTAEETDDTVLGRRSTLNSSRVGRSGLQFQIYTPNGANY